MTLEVSRSKFLSHKGQHMREIVKFGIYMLANMAIALAVIRIIRIGIY